jgi:hypothetical protein
MSNRLDLQAKFEEILGSRNVYFQPPASVSMRYPAIRYKLKDFQTQSANNSGAYIASTGYECILIMKEPAGEGLLRTILQIPYCKFGRYYKAENLHHYTFTIYQ